MLGKEDWIRRRMDCNPIRSIPVVGRHPFKCLEIYFSVEKMNFDEEAESNILIAV